MLTPLKTDVNHMNLLIPTPNRSCLLNSDNTVTHLTRLLHSQNEPHHNDDPLSHVCGHRASEVVKLTEA